MKTIIKNTGIILLVITASFFTACNHDSKNAEITEESINELRSELKEVNSEIDRITADDIEDFNTAAYLVLEKFNQKIEDFEIRMNEKGQVIDQRTKNTINQLKTTSNNLETKLDQLEDKTEDHLVELKHELKYDFAEFGKSVKNFFNDNK
ncbi:MAG: hypothetical protein RBT49_16275 [Bacteroidales bacterium]|jgi:uncharacterized phage infection (PIP) family protein YhgE|nr:hypothetical protein [Bacteroidales bacterium]